MPEQVLMAQFDAANQVSQLLAASGSKTFTLGKVAANAGNAGGLITLTPSAGGSAVALKLENARQIADLSTLAGKTVAVSKPSMLAGAGAANNWLMMEPVKAGTAKAAGSSVTMLKLEGARQGMQAASLTGQKFTVVQPMMAGKGVGSTLFLQPTAGGDLVALKMANTAPAASGLVGKTVSIAKAPAVAGGQKGAWLALKPVAGATAAKGAGGAVVAKAAVAATAPVITPVAATAAPAPAFAPVATTPNGGAVAMTVNQDVAAKAGAFPPGVEVEGLRNGAAAKAKTGAAAKAKAGGAKAAIAKGGAAKAAGAKAAGAKAATTTKAASALKATPVAGGVGNAKMMNVVATSSAGGGGVTASKGLGVAGMGVGAWGVAVIGVLGAAAAYGYYRSRQVEAELSAQEEAPAE